MAANATNATLQAAALPSHTAPTTATQHHITNWGQWILFDGVSAQIHNTIKSSEELATTSSHVGNLQDAIRYYDNYGTQISERLEDKGEVLLLKAKLRERLIDVKALTKSAADAQSQVENQVNDMRIKKITDTQAEIWESIRALFPNEIIAAQGLTPANYKPHSADELALFRSLAPQESGDGWSAEQIFTTLMRYALQQKEGAMLASKLEPELTQLHNEVSSLKLTAEHMEQERWNSERELAILNSTHESAISKLQTDLAGERELTTTLKSDVRLLDTASKKEQFAGQTVGQLQDQLTEWKDKYESEKAKFNNLEAKSNATTMRLEQYTQSSPEPDREEDSTTDMANVKLDLQRKIEALEFKREIDQRGVVELIARLLEAIVYDKVGLHLSDMQLLGAKFQWVQHKANDSPPTNYQADLDDTNKALFASTSATQMTSLNSDFGGLLCACLNPFALDEIRGHIKWLDEKVLPIVCQSGMPEQHHIILCCLLYHLYHLLTDMFNDDVNFAWATCLMTRLACV
ncbi:hypothetical protein LTR08_002488 [Meristemomyces frigidus]|nr:hypothetical protein LTR08_002488 [Meristemomyces frigidus]